MAVIETFLLDQLAYAIEEAKSSSYSSHFSPNLSQLENDCKELKGLMEKKAPKTGAAFDQKIKEKLFCLNNAMLLLKNWHHLNIEARRLVNNLHQSLMEIKKILESVHEGPYSAISEIYQWSYRIAAPAPTLKMYGFEDRPMERLLVRTESTNRFKAIGIVGMAGVGKTALCQATFNNQQVKKHFLPRIWVCLSKQPKDDEDYRKEVVKRVLTCLGFEDKIMDNIGREGGICRLIFALKRQLEGKTYLIVLDDVWNLEEGVLQFCSLFNKDEIKKDQLSYGLPKGHGGTVIATSRSRKMAEKMVGEKNLYSLWPHAEKESCWDIFMNAVKKDGIALPNEVEKLKDKIVEKCAGLPLVAKMMGQIGHENLQKNRENHHVQTKQQMPKPEA